MSEEAEVPKAVRGPFKDRKALLAALLLRDSPTADIRPSSKVNNKQRVRYDCGTPGCKVLLLPFSAGAVFIFTAVQRVRTVRKRRTLAHFFV